jgi:hypothetical protein
MALASARSAQDAGKCKVGRPSFSHLLCFGRGVGGAGGAGSAGSAGGGGGSSVGYCAVKALGPDVFYRGEQVRVIHSHPQSSTPPPQLWRLTACLQRVQGLSLAHAHGCGIRVWYTGAARTPVWYTGVAHTRRSRNPAAVR